MTFDSTRFDLYAQLLDAVARCQLEAVAIEEAGHPDSSGLANDDLQPIPPRAMEALAAVDAVLRRMSLVAPDDVMRAAGDLAVDLTNLIGFVTSTDGRVRRDALRASLLRSTGSPQLEPENEIRDRTFERVYDAREAFIELARRDLGAGAGTFGR